MKFSCTLTQTANGNWQAAHRSNDVGTVSVQAPTREAVLEKLRGEIRYRLELCPCSGDSYQHIDVEIVEQDSTPQ